MMNVSFILPCKNDGEPLKILMGMLFKEIDKSNLIHNYEIIVVDESDDPKTLKIIEGLSREFPEKPIRILNLESGCGLLRSELSGIMNSSFEYKVIMDCDLQHDPSELSKFMEEISMGKNVVIGSRFLEKGSIELTPLRKLITLFSQVYIRIVLPIAQPLTDPTSGYFAFDGSIKVDIADWYGGKTLLFLLSHNPNATIAEVPIKFRAREIGKSKLLNPEYIVNFPLEIFRFRKIYFSKIKSKKGNVNVTHDYLVDLSESRKKSLHHEELHPRNHY